MRPDDEGYDEARTVWNAMIDERQAVTVRCAGGAVEDDALTIDLSPVKSVRVDPDAKTARVEPAVVLEELDHETQQFGLARPVRYNSTTGIAGLTLGGGGGWLSRKHGLTGDTLISAHVVTADGELGHANLVPEDVGDRQATYGENYDRLVQVKNEWDPENRFRLTHNVEPRAEA
ncbi:MULTISPECIES: FAD-binding protein [Haloarcula]|uniref:FAD-binding protein n=1 Tax=Haloarcula TaxID=2237 RepID=UPI0023EB8ACA|nr:FAD-binding protein [Halomicroarcula sp. XH51]